MVFLINFRSNLVTDIIQREMSSITIKIFCLPALQKKPDIFYSQYVHQQLRVVDTSCIVL